MLRSLPLEAAVRLEDGVVMIVSRGKRGKHTDFDTKERLGAEGYNFAFPSTHIFVPRTGATLVRKAEQRSARNVIRQVRPGLVPGGTAPIRRVETPTQ